MSVKFIDGKEALSQQTLVMILKSHKYYFEPLNEYDNTNFYCYIKCETPCIHNDFFYKFFKRFGVKKKENFCDYILSITAVNCCSEIIQEPIAFSRNDILNIITDVPETYIGNSIL